MKKLGWVLLICVMTSAYILFACFSAVVLFRSVTTFFYAEIFLDYSEWQKCDFETGGSIKLPNEWTLCNQNDDFFIIINEAGEEILFGVYSSYCGLENNKQLVYDFNNTSIRELHGAGGIALSNSALYGESMIEYNGVDKMCYIIQMHYSSDVYIYIIDANNLLDENLAKQIAYSYDMTS